MRHLLGRLGRAFAPAAVPIALVAGWELAVRSGWLSSSQTASPVAILGSLVGLVQESSFRVHLGASLARLLTGVCVGATLGATAGMVVGAVAPARRFLAPTLSFMAGVPVIVWIPFWVMAFGVGEIFRVGLVGITAFFLVYAVAFIATRRASRSYIELFRMYEKGGWFTIVNLHLPATAGAVLTATRLALALGWIVLFFVEYAASRPGGEGLGWFVANARAVGRIEEEFAGLLALGVLAFILDAFAGTIQRRWLVWADVIEDHGLRSSVDA